MMLPATAEESALHKSSVFSRVMLKCAAKKKRKATDGADYVTK